MSDDQQPPTFPVPPPPSPTGHSLAGLEPMPRSSFGEIHDRFRPQLEIDGPEAQRRWTVALRLILMLPMILVLVALAVAVVAVLFVSWFHALVRGRVPRWAADFLIGYLAWSSRVSAYGMLMTDRYPGLSFDPVGAVRTDVRLEDVSRLAVFFRWFAFLPANLMIQFLQTGWVLFGFPIWLIVLVRGRMPLAIFEATAAVQRVQLRGYAYFFMLTDAYPLPQVFGDQDPAEESPDDTRMRTRPLRLSRGAKVLLSFLIGFGVIGVAAEVAANAVLDLRLKSLEAATDTYRARNHLYDDYLADVRELRKCSGRLDCLQRNFGVIGGDADRFVGRITAIDYPDEVRTDADALRTEGRLLGDTARRIANAPVDRYDRVLRNAHMDEQVNAILNDATTLGQRLD